jgi:hypothetical protein
VPLTISKLEADSLYSAAGFAADSAQAVPEPSTWALSISALVLIVLCGEGKR